MEEKQLEPLEQAHDNAMRTRHQFKTRSALHRFMLKRLVHKALKKRTLSIVRSPQRKIRLNPIQYRRNKPEAPQQER